MTFLFLLLLLILSWAFFFPLFPFIAVAIVIYVIVKFFMLLFAPVKACASAASGIISESCEGVDGPVNIGNPHDNYDNPWLYTTKED